MTRLAVAAGAIVVVRMAEDLANVINDGATRRIVPVVGMGSLANLTDLKHLRGIDMAILQTDVLDYAKEQRLFSGIEGSVTYVAKLHNEEFHLLARREIKSVADLANQTVNVDLRDSGTAITASRLFAILKLPVTMTNDRPEVALEKLRKGEIAALAFVAGKPAPLYPGLVPQDLPVDTVAVGIVLVVANLEQVPERYRNVANFVDAFFIGFQSLLEPGHHPKWQEVNISTELPGWRRYPPAEQWLRRNMEVVRAPSPEDLKAMFAHYIDERRRTAGGAPMTQQEKDDLFQQYHRWESGQAR